MKHYAVNEVFYSLQGEGIRSGSANVFVRFAGCNLRCNGTQDEQAYQPVCDTEFMSHLPPMAGEELLAAIISADRGKSRNVIFTGGEPALQLDEALLEMVTGAGYYVAAESNGTRALPAAVDWVCVSPKTAEHTLAEQRIDELKYVRPAGMAIPKPRLHAFHYLLSPAFDERGLLTKETLQWCIKLVQDNPKWRLSVQQHKAWAVR